MGTREDARPPQSGLSAGPEGRVLRVPIPIHPCLIRVSSVAPYSAFGGFRNPHSAFRIPQNVTTDDTDGCGCERPFIRVNPCDPAPAAPAFCILHSAFFLHSEWPRPQQLTTKQAAYESCVSITASIASTYQISHCERFDNPLSLNDSVEPGRPIGSASLAPRGTRGERGCVRRTSRSADKCDDVLKLTPAPFSRRGRCDRGFAHSRAPNYGTTPNPNSSQ